MMNKPIPAFYACYLLRSTVRHASLYVGSTPNPIRRLRQHNGDTKGGAVRTSKDSLRPWEMTCLVTGFPSKVAALQFEWAWQNTHLTRHISPNTRITQSRTAVRISPRTGRPRKRPARPRLSLTDRLANLHLLLRASSFECWPLNVTFYSEDVYRVWQKWMQQGVEPLRSGIEVSLDASARPPNDPTSAESGATSGIPSLEVTYAPMKQHLEKVKDVLASSPRCTVCAKQLPANGAMTLICPNTSCHAAGHLSCLASAFSHAEQLVPTTGKCPSCSTELQWIDLVKELSLRMRGDAEVQKVFKVRKPRGKQNGAVLVAPSLADKASEDEDQDQADDDMAYLSLSDDSEPDVPQAEVAGNGLAATTRPFAADPFIEDSDWNDDEVIK